MADGVSAREARVAELEQGLQRTEERLASLERAAADAPKRPRVPPPAAAREAAAAQKVGAELTALAGGLSFVGRTLLVLAGAFLLRALTDSGTLPGWLGVALGLAYAGTWVLLADRASAAAHVTSAAFHGFCAAAIGFP